MAKRVNTAVRMTIRWNSRRKLWELIGVVIDSGGVVTRVIDTRAELDVAGLRRVVDAIELEMQSWLF